MQDDRTNIRAASLYYRLMSRLFDENKESSEMVVVSTNY